MKKSAYLMTSLAVCAVLLSCNADRKPPRTASPATAPAAATAAAAAASKADTFNLVGTDWVLENLAGGEVAPNVRATLSFPEAGKVAGNGSCNRFFGQSQIAGTEIKLGPLGSTRMACPEPLMSQETKYLNALQAAERYKWEDPYLLIYCKELEKPLRFTRAAASPSTAK
jgi:heat shock protein HslJ